MSKARWQEGDFTRRGLPQERWPLWLAMVVILAACGFRAQPLAAAETGSTGGLGDQMLSALTHSSEAQSQRASSSNPDLDSNGDSWTVKAGTKTAIDITGCGRGIYFGRLSAGGREYAIRVVALQP